MAGRQNDPDLEQKLKTSLWYHVGRICDEICEENEMTASKQFIASVADCVYRHSATLATDLEAFAKHAKRNTVNSDDVILYGRKIPTLHSHLQKIDSENQQHKKKKSTKVTKNNKSKTKTDDN